MKYKALLIKNWIINEISPLGWVTLVTRAMPELLENNHRFSASRISENTSWTQTEIDILNWYLKKIFQKQIPFEILASNGFLEVNYLELVGFSFFDSGQSFKSIGNKIRQFFKF